MPKMNKNVMNSQKNNSMKGAANEALDTALYLWFVQKRSEGVPLSGTVVAEKAMFFNAEINGEASKQVADGWIISRIGTAYVN